MGTSSRNLMAAIHTGLDDIVAFIHDGAIQYGELISTVGVTSTNSSNLFSFVTLWETINVDSDYVNCRISADAPLLRIDVVQLRTSCTYAMSLDRTSCVVVVPPVSLGQSRPV